MPDAIPGMLRDIARFRVDVLRAARLPPIVVPMRLPVFVSLLLCLAAAAVPAAQQRTQSQRSTAATAQAKELTGAFQALARGDGAAAAAVFDEALKTNPRDPVLLYGSGAAAYLQGRNSEATDKLTLALELEPRLTAADQLLGEIEYLRGDLDAAIERYEKALPGAGPLAPALQSRLDKWRKEASVHRTLSRSSDARFSVVFDGRSNDSLATHANGLLEREFQRISQQIGAYPPNRILVILYTEQQFRDITHSPTWSVGAFDGKVRIPVAGVSQDRERFDRTLTHELVHAMIFGLAPTGVPAWLHEGLASYFEPEDVNAALARVQRAGVVIPLANMQDSFARLNAASAAAAYDQSLIAADLLARAVGPRMASLLKGLGRGQSFSEAMGLVGMRASEFEDQLKRRLAR